jgi:uncharacterized protein (DUF4213/DUF364 family)
MNARPDYIASARHGAGLVIEALRSLLMPDAQERTIRQVVAGARFCAVVLDDGGTGVAHLCQEVCGEPPPWVSDRLPQPGTAAAELLATLGSSAKSALGLATANALANRPDKWDATAIGGDLLDVIELRPDDRVGMVGCFSPLVEPIRQRVRRLFIFERGPRLAPDLLPENRAADLLPECSVALITATTLMNGTIDALLSAAAHCREVVLLGPSTPLVADVFADSHRRASLLSGVVVTDSPGLVRVVARGGGTRDFGTSVSKVNLRVRAAGAAPA